MKQNFEIKYLELKWYDKETLTKVVESMNALRVDYDEERQHFLAETTIYPKLEGIYKGHLGIRFFDKSTDSPFIEMPNGDRNYLSSIKDPETGHVWWIAKDKWDEIHNRWLGIAPNIVGKLKLSLRGQRCEILVNGFDFSHAQLEQYLRTFKNDLWELILDDSSPVTAEAKASNGIGINDEIIECINRLVHHAKLVLRTPKSELREVQKLQPKRAVKPVNRTFMELATKTNHRFLTSRASSASYNVAENRYVLFALERCYRILRQVVTLANNKSQRYKDTIDRLKNQINSLMSTQIKVDRDLVVADLKAIRERKYTDYWQGVIDEKIKIAQLPLQKDACPHNLVIKLEQYTNSRHTKQNDGFFIRFLSGSNWVRPNHKSGILRFAGPLIELTSILEPGMSLQINCDHTYRETERSVTYTVQRLYSLQVREESLAIQRARDAFKREREIGQKLASNNWIKSLSKQEVEEYEKEKKAIENRIRFYEKNQALAVYVHDKVEPKFRALKKLIIDFKALKITPDSHFPNSMTFVQNPHYQGVHNSYKVLRDVTNLSDDEVLVSLEKIDEIGLINMPLIYERWVLVQLILVLKERFRFTPQANWRYQLIDAIQTNNEDINIKLDNSEAKRYISLWYEKTLPNNRRPDFLIDLKWFSENDAEYKQKHYKRFVLDAKFYNKDTFAREGGMMAKINELYIDKDYGEDSKNSVFLIHPCSDLLERQWTSQAWGKYSYLGELNIDEDEAPPSHEKGAILLNPVDKEVYADELQRLLGLFLQYKLEPNDTIHLKNDRTLAVPICIRCGSSHVQEIRKSEGYRNKRGEWIERTPRSVWMKCSECEQTQIYNHCASRNCKRTRLIKNGLYWTYHSARAIEPFNLKCPTCGEWGAW